MSGREGGGHRRLLALIRGRVQGVGFRATTVDEARRLGLAGWVRNRIDGTVETVAEGPESTLRLFLGYLKRGPLGARVSSVTEEWADSQGERAPFEWRRTE
jgi:acylphosphatase